jgi:hypothetical protein
MLLRVHHLLSYRQVIFSVSTLMGHSLIASVEIQLQ